MKQIFLLSAALALVMAGARAADAPQKDAKTPDAKVAATTKVQENNGVAVPLQIEGVENPFRIGHKIISGACPNGEAGFVALAKMGVKTIITVDGARPDEAIAKKLGMRYVHIPVPYSGISRAQSLAIARAVRDLPGPVFIHCHHGKHRGPTAAVLAAMITDGWTMEQAQDAMKQAGTAKTYTGLWGAVRDFKPASKEELDRADATFPAAVALEAMASTMVAMDEKWEALGDSKKVKWNAPDAHPDFDAAHEAFMLREDFTELLRSPDMAKHPEDFRLKMTASQTAVTALESALRAKNYEQADAAYKMVDASCKSCHAVYRDPDGEAK